MEIESAIAKSLQRLGYTELNVDYSVKRAMKGKGKNVWCSLVAIRIAGKVGKEAGNVSREIAEFMELNREEIGLDQDVERIVGEENGFINFYLRQVDESKDVEVEAEIEQNLSSFALDENLDFGFSENVKKESKCKMFI
jgi:arginyl-tRNA synthetase